METVAQKVAKYRKILEEVEKLAVNVKKEYVWTFFELWRKAKRNLGLEDFETVETVSTDKASKPVIRCGRKKKGHREVSEEVRQARRECMKKLWAEGKMGRKKTT